jgi:squalene-associated FAD-dependent desaturase
MTVAVVGGGLAGISAAFTLADAGQQVTLFESRGWLGGATYSFTRDGLTIDNGQHVFLRCCSAYRGLLSRLGVAEWAPVRRLDIPVLQPGARVVRLRRSRWLPAPVHVAGSLARYAPLPVADRLRAVRGMAALRRPMPESDVAFGSWLAAHGQRAVAVERLWGLIARPTLNIDPAEASAQLAGFVFRTAMLTDRLAADIGVADVPLSQLHGEPALGALRAVGVDVRLRSKVTVLPTDVAAVVLAVPPDVARDLLPGLSTAGLGSSPIVDLHVVYDRPVTRLRFAAAVDSPVQWVFDRTSPAGLSSGQYLAVSLSAAEEWIDQPVGVLRGRFLPELARLFPAAATAGVRQFVVTRERRATLRQSVGVNALRPGPVTDVPDVYLAGAWTDTGWPDTMEGAVRSGQAAAAALLAGQPRLVLAGRR